MSYSGKTKIDDRDAYIL
jgi:outer membrane lipoprotein-sorting protein